MPIFKLVQYLVKKYGDDLGIKNDLICIGGS